FLNVQKKTGEVLDQAHVALDDECLGGERHVTRARLEIGRQRIAGSVTPFGHLFARRPEQAVAVVKADPARRIVVLANDARRMKMRRVRLRGQAIAAARAEASFVLADGGAALGVPVLAKAGGPVDLAAAKGVRALAGWAEQADESLRPEAARR